MILTVLLRQVLRWGYILYKRKLCRIFNSRNRSAKQTAGGSNLTYPGDEFLASVLASGRNRKKWWYPCLFPDISHRDGAGAILDTTDAQNVPETPTRTIQPADATENTDAGSMGLQSRSIPFSRTADR